MIRKDIENRLEYIEKWIDDHGPINKAKVRRTIGKGVWKVKQDGNKYYVWTTGEYRARFYNVFKAHEYAAWLNSKEGNHDPR